MNNYTSVEKECTFIVFQKGKVDDFAGPLFDEQVEKVKKELNDEGIFDLESMQEDVFRIMYPEIYVQSFKLDWFNFVTYRIESIIFEDDIKEFDIYIDEEEETIFSELFIIEKDHLNDILNIYFSVNCNPKFVATIMYELVNYVNDIFEITICNNFHISMNKEIFYGEEATMCNEMERNYIILN